MPARSLRIVLAAIGSRGDVQPALALAQALAERGHVPVVAAPPNFQTWVTGLGFEFKPLGMDIQVFLQDNPEVMTGHPLKLTREVIRYLTAQWPQHVTQLALISEGADIIVHAGIALMTGPIVAEAMRLPSLGVLYTNCLMPSSLHPPPTIRARGLPGWLNRWLWQLDHVLANLFVRGMFNRRRASLQLAPVRNVRHYLFEQNAPVIAIDETLFPPDPRWDGLYAYTGFLFLDDPAPLDPQLDAWLRDGEPPVFVGFGSMSGKGIDRAGKMMLDAVSATGRRCIVGAGWGGLGAGELPDGWRVVRDAPHALLFPRMAVVVHHGGSGTTAQALRAGVPQVLVPLFLDQFHHAHRLHLAGLAPKPVAMEKMTPAQLAASLAAALALPAGPRQAAAQRLRASDARGDIVRRVEAIAGHAR